MSNELGGGRLFCKTERGLFSHCALAPMKRALSEVGEGGAHDQGRQKLNPHYHERQEPDSCQHQQAKCVWGQSLRHPSEQNNVFIEQDQVKVQQRNHPPNYYYIIIIQENMYATKLLACPFFFPSLPDQTYSDLLSFLSF